jgi:hypothetical protein
MASEKRREQLGISKDRRRKQQDQLQTRFSICYWLDSNGNWRRRWLSWAEVVRMCFMMPFEDGNSIAQYCKQSRLEIPVPKPRWRAINPAISYSKNLEHRLLRFKRKVFELKFA